MSALYADGDYERILIENTDGSSGSASYRDHFRKDYGRLLHSAAFRRLQGKTQLFPSDDFDFFRNRLTHSMEVAQIAHCIAAKLNRENPIFAQPNSINTNLVEFAALAHDIGHPPFGHNGEKTLNNIMGAYGGFEGNAQTLRIISGLSNKFTGPLISGKTRQSFGLNLTKRALASILKRDHQIPIPLVDKNPVATKDSKGNKKAEAQNQKRRSGEQQYDVDKGYYFEEAKIVEDIKEAVLRDIVLDAPLPSPEFRTLECSIMDVADDIAYSVYDLEDAFKAGFLTSLDLVAPDGGAAVEQSLLHEVNKALKKEGLRERPMHDLFIAIFRLIELGGDIPSSGSLPRWLDIARIVVMLKNRARNSVERTEFTSRLVGRFVSAVDVKESPYSLALSQAYLPEETRVEVEVLKNLTYVLSIHSHRLRIVRARGQKIVRTIFESIEHMPELLPDDFLIRYRDCGGNAADQEQRRKRVICDFVSGMTDRYASEFYARLGSEDHRPIFTPM